MIVLSTYQFGNNVVTANFIKYITISVRSTQKCCCVKVWRQQSKRVFAPRPRVAKFFLLNFDLFPLISAFLLRAPQFYLVNSRLFTCRGRGVKTRMAKISHHTQPNIKSQIWIYYFGSNTISTNKCCRTWYE
jgi:hypothetical protein